MKVGLYMATASVLLCATLTPVELFKFGKSHQQQQPQLLQQQSSAPLTGAELDSVERLYQQQPQQQLYLAPPRYYQMPGELLRQAQPQLVEQPAVPLFKGLEFHASKTFGKSYSSGQATLAAGPSTPLAVPVQPVPQSIAYLVVRPILAQPQVQTIQQAEFPRPEETKGGRQLEQQQLLHADQLPSQTLEQQPNSFDQSYYANYYLQQQQQQLQHQHPHEQQKLTNLRQQAPASTKGGRQSEEQVVQTIQAIEQQHEQTTGEQQQQQQQQQQQAFPQPALVVPVAPGKEGKLRAMLDRLMSKLTLGSTYQVMSEEIVTPSTIQQQQKQQDQQDQQVKGPEKEVTQHQQIEQQAHIEDQRLEQQLEQQRDHGFDEAATKQAKQQLQQQEQLRDEQLQQSLAELELNRQRQQQQAKGQQEPLRQEPVRQQEFEAPTKGKRSEQQQLQAPAALPVLVSQEPSRQEAKGNY